MKLEFKGTTYNDLDFWAKNDKRKLIRIFELVEDTIEIISCKYHY